MKRFTVPALVLALAATMMAAPQGDAKKGKATPTPVTSTEKGDKAGAKGKAKGKGGKRGGKAKETTTPTK
jgi:hypothetical protein